MKKLSKSIAIIMVLVLSITTVGVISNNYQNIVEAKTINKKKISLNKKKATVRVNKTLKLKLKNVKAKKVKWSSSNKIFATVSKKGKVTALKKGKVTITAKYKGKKYKCTVIVKKAKTLKTEINGSTLQQAIYLADSLYKDRNIAVSPASLNMALGMAANAASTKELKNIESYLGKPLAEYNKYSKKLMKRSKNDEMLTLANGVWYRDIYTINPLFSNAVSNIYKANIKSAPMDSTTVDEINQWASDNTDGIIPKVINEIPKETVSILSNALLFEGKWTEPFEAEDTKNGKFTTASGTKVKAKMMNDCVGTYFENKYAKGFEKTYGENGEYSFIAVLPKKEGDFNLADMDIEGLLQTKSKKYDVYIRIPKFTYSWSDSLKDVLKNTELEPIFDESGNSLGKLLQNTLDDVFVEDILQSCKVIMDEDGTKAAAVTIIYADTSTAIIERPPVKKVYLNRPFGYIIMDNKTDEVLFMGKVVDVSQN